MFITLTTIIGEGNEVLCGGRGDVLSLFKKFNTESMRVKIN